MLWMISRGIGPSFAGGEEAGERYEEVEETRGIWVSWSFRARCYGPGLSKMSRRCVRPLGMSETTRVSGMKARAKCNFVLRFLLPSASISLDSDHPGGLFAISSRR